MIAMRELLRTIFDSASALKTQLLAAVSIPLAEANQVGGRENAASDSMLPWERQRSIGKSFKCVDDHPGYLTGNGLGSLEIGASHDD